MGVARVTLCPPARCGCAFDTDTLQISRTSSGRTSIDLPPAYVGSYPGFIFLDAAERLAEIPAPEEGMESWLRATDDKWRHDGTAWRLIGKTGTYTPVLAGWTLGSGGSVVGRYSRAVANVEFEIVLTLGTGFAISAALFLGLPFSAANVVTSFRNAARVSFHDVGSQVYAGTAVIQGATDVGVHVLGTGGTYATATTDPTASIPFSWVAGDQVTVMGGYVCDITDSTAA